MRAILHDWDDEDAMAILRACRRAIPPDGRLLVIERVIAPPNEGAAEKLSDLNMLVSPGGRERTRAEYEALLGAAGFQLTTVVPTGVETCIIEAIPA